MLLTQLARLALDLALASAGSSKAARIAMMAMTTNSSMRVKPERFVGELFIAVSGFGTTVSVTLALSIILGPAPLLPATPYPYDAAEGILFQTPSATFTGIGVIDPGRAR